MSEFVTCTQTVVLDDEFGDTVYAPDLTVGKSYSVMSRTDHGFLITDDAGDIFAYDREFFSK